MKNEKNKRKSVIILFAAIMVVSILAAIPMVSVAMVSVATPTVINFEEFRAASLGGLGGAYEIKDYYYSTYGVTFTGATSLSKTDGSLNYGAFPPKSGDAVVYDSPSQYAGIMTITFSTSQSSVGGYFTASRALTFTAYDASGTIVGTDNSLNEANYVGSGSSIPPNHYLHVDYAGGITKVVIGDAGDTYTLDDLTFLLDPWQEINEELDELIEKVDAADMPYKDKQKLIRKLEYAKVLKDNAKIEYEEGNFDYATKKLGAAKKLMESFEHMVKGTRQISPADKASFLAESAKIIEKIDELIKCIETEPPGC